MVGATLPHKLRSWMEARLGRRRKKQPKEGHHLCVEGHGSHHHEKPLLHRHKKGACVSSPAVHLTICGNSSPSAALGAAGGGGGGAAGGGGSLSGRGCDPSLSSPESAYSTAHSEDGISPAACPNLVSYSPSYLLQLSKHQELTKTALLSLRWGRASLDAGALESADAISIPRSPREVHISSVTAAAAGPSGATAEGEDRDKRLNAPRTSAALAATADSRVSPKQRSRIRTNPWLVAGGAAPSPNAAAAATTTTAAAAGTSASTSASTSALFRNPSNVSDLSCSSDAHNTDSTRDSGCSFSSKASSSLRWSKTPELDLCRISESSMMRASAAAAGAHSTGVLDNCDSFPEVKRRLSCTSSYNSEEEFTINELIGKFDESYVYEKETDIISDVASDLTDCDDLQEADLPEGETNSDSGDMGFIDEESREDEARLPKSTMTEMERRKRSGSTGSRIFVPSEALGKTELSNILRVRHINAPPEHAAHARVRAQSITPTGSAVSTPKLSRSSIGAQSPRDSPCSFQGRILNGNSPDRTPCASPLRTPLLGSRRSSFASPRVTPMVTPTPVRRVSITRPHPNPLKQVTETVRDVEDDKRYVKLIHEAEHILHSIHNGEGENSPTTRRRNNGESTSSASSSGCGSPRYHMLDADGLSPCVEAMPCLKDESPAPEVPYQTLEGSAILDSDMSSDTDLLLLSPASLRGGVRALPGPRPDQVSKRHLFPHFDRIARGWTPHSEPLRRRQFPTLGCALPSSPQPLRTAAAAGGFSAGLRAHHPVVPKPMLLRSTQTTSHRSLNEIRQSLEAKVRALRHERLHVELKIRAAQHEARERQAAQVQLQTEADSCRRKLLGGSLFSPRKVSPIQK